MPIYKFKCLTCDEDHESIEKMDAEWSFCPKCDRLSERLHGVDLPAPAQIEAGVGGVDRPRFGERKYA